MGNRITPLTYYEAEITLTDEEGNKIKITAPRVRFGADNIYEEHDWGRDGSWPPDIIAVDFTIQARRKGDRIYEMRLERA